MEKVVNEALTLLLEDWLQDSRGKTFDLVTEDVISTKNIFCNCLKKHSIDYQVVENKLIIGNKKIYIYDKMKYYHL